MSSPTLVKTKLPYNQCFFLVFFLRFYHSMGAESLLPKKVTLFSDEIEFWKRRTKKPRKTTSFDKSLPNAHQPTYVIANTWAIITPPLCKFWSLGNVMNFASRKKKQTTEWQSSLYITSIINSKLSKLLYTYMRL